MVVEKGESRNNDRLRDSDELLRDGRLSRRDGSARSMGRVGRVRF